MTDKKHSVRRTRRSGSEPTLVDVAKVAGVSPITVSRALNQPALVSERARKKVAAAVEKTGYVLNMQAGSLASRNSRLIAIIVPTIAHSIFSSTVQAITDIMSANGYQTLLGLSGYHPQQEQELIETILGRRPDGIVLTGILHTEQSRKRLQATNIPIVEMWDLTRSPIDSLVGFSHQRVGISVANYLLDKGYRNIAIVSADDKRALKRKRGLLSALRKRGITHAPDVTVQAPTSVRIARSAVSELLDSKEKIDVVYCSSDTLALGVISELQNRGMKIPTDIAVIGFGDMEFAAHSFPSITSVEVNGYEIGKLSATTLLEHIKEPNPEHRKKIHRDVGFTIIERQSA